MRDNGRVDGPAFGQNGPKPYLNQGQKYSTTGQKSGSFGQNKYTDGGGGSQRYPEDPPYMFYSPTPPDLPGNILLTGNEF